jgi:hypothetical protein
LVENGSFGNPFLARMTLLSNETAAERQSERADTPEHVLVEILLLNVEKDGYYSLRTIKNCMAGYFCDEYWLTERSVGRILRRLGFTTWRRMAYGTEYFFKVSQVRDLAQRLGISEDSVDSEDTGKEGTLEERVIVWEEEKLE